MGSDADTTGRRWSPGVRRHPRGGWTLRLDGHGAGVGGGAEAGVHAARALGARLRGRPPGVAMRRAVPAARERFIQFSASWPQQPLWLPARVRSRPLFALVVHGAFPEESGTWRRLLAAAPVAAVRARDGRIRRGGAGQPRLFADQVLAQACRRRGAAGGARREGGRRVEALRGCCSDAQARGDSHGGCGLARC